MSEHGVERTRDILLDTVPSAKRIRARGIGSDLERHVVSCAMIREVFELSPRNGLRGLALKPAHGPLLPHQVVVVLDLGGSTPVGVE